MWHSVEDCGTQWIVVALSLALGVLLWAYTLTGQLYRLKIKKQVLVCTSKPVFEPILVHMSMLLVKRQT